MVAKTSCTGAEELRYLEIWESVSSTSSHETAADRFLIATSLAPTSEAVLLGALEIRRDVVDECDIYTCC